MSWGAIKRVLNSTLGTSKFKSLDKLLIGERRLFPCENHKVNIPSYSHITLYQQTNPEIILSLINKKMDIVGNTTTIIGSFTPMHSGTITVNLIGVYYSDSNKYINIYNSKNELIHSQSIGSINTDTNYNFTIDVVHNETYTVKVISSSNNELYIYSLDLLCYVKDVTAIDYIKNI